MAIQCVNHPTVTSGVVRCRRCERTFCRNCVVALRGQYYCAACKRDQVRDIQSGTEEGVLEFASIGRRFAAQCVDTAIVVAVLTPIMMFGVFGAMTAAGPENADALAGGLMMVAIIGAVAVVFLYEGLMLGARGQTLGKMAVGVKVVTPEGQTISVGQAWLRALIRQVFFSWFALINYLPALFTKQKTAIHDLVGKTRVVRYRR